MGKLQTAGYEWSVTADPNSEWSPVQLIAGIRVFLEHHGRVLPELRPTPDSTKQLTALSEGLLPGRTRTIFLTNEAGTAGIIACYADDDGPADGEPPSPCATISYQRC